MDQTRNRRPREGAPAPGYLIAVTSVPPRCPFCGAQTCCPTTGARCHSVSQCALDALIADLAAREVAGRG